MAAKDYSAEAIEVLQGLDPVRKRPGMYTDTTRPNHLAQEVIDNARRRGAGRVIAATSPSRSTRTARWRSSDDGRGMPVDIHPVHKVTGVELILTKLHSGAKFSNKKYQFSGGLHGVGVSRGQRAVEQAGSACLPRRQGVLDRVPRRRAQQAS